MENEILKNTKMLLELTDDTFDNKLNFYITDIQEEILAYCRLEFLPRQLSGVVAQIAAHLFKAEDENIIAITEGDRKLEFANNFEQILKKYHSRLKPFQKLSARLPSEVTEIV